MSNVIVCAVIIVASIFFYLEVLSYPEVSGLEKGTAHLWPKVVLILTFIFALITLIESTLKAKKGMISGKKSEEPINMKGLAACSLILFFFIFLIPYIGFLPAAVPSTILTVYALGEKKIMSNIIYSLSIVAFIYLSFGKILLVPLPRGVSIFREFSYLLY